MFPTDEAAAIKTIWAGHTPQIRPPKSKGCGSSVLIPLIRTDMGYDILFEIRAFHLDKQPGEVCLPGGRREPGETPRETAIRETAEELLVDRDQIHMIAELDGAPGPGGACIWPFVGMLSDYQDTWSRDEVDRTFRVPFSWFLAHEPEVYEVAMQTVPGEDFPFDRLPHGREYPWKQQHREVCFYQYGDITIWGVTAGLIRAFVKDYTHGSVD